MHVAKSLKALGKNVRAVFGGKMNCIFLFPKCPLIFYHLFFMEKNARKKNKNLLERSTFPEGFAFFV